MESVLSEVEKVKVATDFLLQAPPGEFNEVFNDVRILIDNDTLLKDSIMKVIAKYNMEHFIPCKLPSEEDSCLITAYAECGNGKFYNPRTKKIFSYDHLKHEVSNVEVKQRLSESATKSDKWRTALDEQFSAYVKEYYPNSTSSIYGKFENGTTTLICCLEDHNFNPKNFWNGRWRSCWVATFTEGKAGELKGVFKIIVHYYEDGNVQLLAKKEVKKPFNSSTPESTAKDIVKLISAEEHTYQTSLADCYQTMSETTFKALRRQLPITRAKLDWEKVTLYKIASKLKTR